MATSNNSLIFSVSIRFEEKNVQEKNDNYKIQKY